MMFKVLNGLESHHGGKGRYPGINYQQPIPPVVALYGPAAR